MENIINQIQKDIINETSLPTILRKAKVLAFNLKNEEFKAWVDNELNGYKDNTKVPDYIKAHTENLAYCVDPDGNIIKNLPIPSSSLPEEFREKFEKIMKEPIHNVILWESVAVLENLKEQNISHTVKRWPPDLVYYLNMISPDFSSVKVVKKVVPKTLIIQALDTIRNRLLNFVLELQEEYPKIKNSNFDITEIPKEQITNVFITNIYGRDNIISSGTNFTQLVEIKKNDIDSLIKYMESKGLTKEDTNELKKAMGEDGEITEQRKFGPKVKEWIEKMTKKAKEGTWNVGKSVAEKILTEALLKYFGLK